MRYYYVSMGEWAVIKWFLVFLKFLYFETHEKKINYEYIKINADNFLIKGNSCSI